MTLTWTPDDEPRPVRAGLTGWIRALVRGFFLILLLFLGVVIKAAFRLVEAPVFGVNRPVTPYITQWVCRSALVILGITRNTQGTPMTHPGAIVANHSSWLDIFTLNAGQRMYFVSKSEVAGWPGIGLLARITGTVFIARDPRQAKAQTDLFEERMLAGHKLLFFPEGTSTDGLRVLRFKTTLFQSFFSENLRHDMQIQPVTVIYSAPERQDPRYYGWWGDMALAPHLLQVLATARQGSVDVIYHPPVRVDAFANRKALTAHLEANVRGGMPPERQSAG